MTLINRIFLLLAVWFAAVPVTAQEDSCDLRISLLTASPGDELYSIFGHSAIRVTSPTAHTDLVYNYGGFEFDDDFYYKFVKGGEQLQYYVFAQSFADFMVEYREYNRSVSEQALTLGCDDKHRLYSALKVNTTEANRYYRYDFLYDNCATRLRDMVVANTSPPAIFRNILPPQPPSFRNQIHEYLNKGKQYWSKLGIDLLLGARMDKKATNAESMFLPDYLMKGFDSAFVGSIPLVHSKRLLLPITPRPGDDDEPWFRPLGFTLFLLVFGVVLQLIKKPWARIVLNIFDALFFFVLGALGLLIAFMWFGTDHALCKDNFNVLWAVPTHLIAAFFVTSKRSAVGKYFGLCSIIAGLTVIAWSFLPQQMNPAFLPLTLLAAIRCYDRFKRVN